jgi:putative ABC transport system permease protein
MTLWHIAWSYLWNRKLTTAMTIASLALSVGLITAVLTLREETRKRFEEEGQMFDAVIGAKGNPLQLVLNAVYFMDTPTGNITHEEYERIKGEEGVVAAFPIGMGDTFSGYHIVGTVPEFFDYRWGSEKSMGFELAEGRYFGEAPFEAVIGAQVALDTGLAMGETFHTTHGFIDMPDATGHADHHLTVVGFLERTGTPADRAIFTSLQSVWDAHAHMDEDDHPADCADPEDCHDHDHAHDHHHGEEVTAVLVDLFSPAARFEFVERVNTRYNAMAAIPVGEIKKLYDQLLGTAKAVLLAIGYLVVVISSFSILIGLYMAILQRRRDLAIMRALGASPGEIFGSVIIEAFWVTLLGLGAGWITGSVTCWVLGRYLAQKVGFQISAINMTADLVGAYSAVVLIGLLAGILPAVQAYRTHVAQDLAEL